MSRHFPGSIAVVVVVLVLTLNCYARSAAEDRTRVAEPRSSPSEILQLAASNLPDARAQIATHAESGSRPDARALARLILSLWDDRLNSYSSSQARYVSYPSIDTPPPVFAVAEIVVSEAGTALSVTVLKTDQPERIPEIEAFLKGRTYLPARVDGRYTQSTAAALLRREVR